MNKIYRVVFHIWHKGKIKEQMLPINFATLDGAKDFAKKFLGTNLFIILSKDLLLKTSIISIDKNHMDYNHPITNTDKWYFEADV